MKDLLEAPWYEAAPERWAAKREELREKFVGLLGVPAWGMEDDSEETATASYPARLRQGFGGHPSLKGGVDLQWHEETREGDLTIRKLSFLAEPDDRVYAYLVVPDGIELPAPTVMCIHGTTADAKEACLGRGERPGGSNGLAIDLAKKGFVTFAPDHFIAGERLKPGQNPYDPRPFYERHPNWSEMGKDLHDHRLCLDVLEGLPEVDAGRMGCIGHSLGGYGSVFLAAMDERIRAGVSSCGVTVWAADPLKFNWSRFHAGEYVHFPRLREYWRRGLPAPVDFHEIMALISPRAFLNISAVGNDSCFPIFEPFAELYTQVEGVYKLLGAEGKFGCHFHSSGHSFGDSARQLAYAWLGEQMNGGD